MQVLTISSKHVLLYTHILDEASRMCFHQRPLITCYVWSRKQYCGRQARQSCSWIKAEKHICVYKNWCHL